MTYSNNKIVPVKDAGDHITDPVVKEIFDAAQEEMQKAMDEYLSTKSDSGAADDTAEEATDDAE